MCFSATASFTSAAIIGVIGIVGVYQAQQFNKNYLALNCLPLLFAIQQFCEGMVWTSANHFSLNLWAKLFLLFAFLIYPWYMGFATRFIAINASRKKILGFFVIIGLLYGIWSYWNILGTQYELPRLCEFSVKYHISYLGIDEGTRGHQIYAGITTVIYLALVLLPCYISGPRWLKWFGTLAFIAFVVTLIFEMRYLISIWCFYCAVISIFIVAMTTLLRYGIFEDLSSRPK